MRIITFLSIFLLVAISHITVGQTTLRGSISNEKGEKLSSAVIFIPEHQLSAISDEAGLFEITGVPVSDFTLEVTYLGYQKYSRSFTAQETTRTADVVLRGHIFDLDKIEVVSNRVGERTPFTSTTLTEASLNKRNSGQDVPFLLGHTPSVVVTSDAGAGIGYTGLRIRGSDPTRINVTINDVPLNDAESHGVFWVDLPDIASSAHEIQVHRGVGPSTNGAGAYGGTISVNTKKTQVNPYITATGGWGSFNTARLGVSLGTGLINNHWSIDGRYSLIKSDGYIDRASANLNSYYLSVSRVSSASSLRFITFSGKERTYQAWYGVPESRFENNEADLLAHYNRNTGSLYNNAADSINLFSSDQRYNYYTYEDQVDDYNQSHYQLHHAKKYGNSWTLRSSVFYTRGKGYYEELKSDAGLVAHGLPLYIEGGDTTETADLVRRRWLDNHFYGALFNAEFVLPKNTLVLGGMLSQYRGKHYGKVVTTAVPVELDKSKDYYSNEGKKNDFNVFVRNEYRFNNIWSLFADAQLRAIQYDANGVDNGGVAIDVDTSYLFFNPKVGIDRTFGRHRAYASVAVAHREPVRSDFIDNPSGNTPHPERLVDYELGIRTIFSKTGIGFNLFYMDYYDQLVVTGDLNDVGASIRTNVDRSYRLGIEVEGETHWSDRLTWRWNISLSRNKIKEFNEVLFDYSDGFERLEIRHTDTDIAFSPSLVAQNTLQWQAMEDFNVSFETKVVGRQFLDNTSNSARSLDPFTYSNLTVEYSLGKKVSRPILLRAQINNVFNARYAASGYTYSYGFDGVVTENYVYPQAGIHGMFTAVVRF